MWYNQKKTAVPEGDTVALSVEKLVRVDDGMLDIMTEWMYRWWGENEGHSREEIRCYMEHGVQ